MNWNSLSVEQFAKQGFQCCSGLYPQDLGQWPGQRIDSGVFSLNNGETCVHFWVWNIVQTEKNQK